MSLLGGGCDTVTKPIAYHDYNNDGLRDRMVEVRCAKDGTLCDRWIGITNPATGEYESLSRTGRYGFFRHVEYTFVTTRFFEPQDAQHGSFEVGDRVFLRADSSHYTVHSFSYDLHPDGSLLRSSVTLLDGNKAKHKVSADDITHTDPARATTFHSLRAQITQLAAQVRADHGAIVSRHEEILSYAPREHLFPAPAAELRHLEETLVAAISVAALEASHSSEEQRHAFNVLLDAFNLSREYFQAATPQS